ncbi:MAG: hypothetical protein HYU74_12480 [Dechloromonas sp.]|nr:hypothetical protein [Dechloromonas sp.]
MKPWWKSKIVQVNLAFVVLAAIETQLHFIQPYLPVDFYAAIAFALPPINAVLRFLTNQPISFWGQE